MPSIERTIALLVRLGRRTRPVGMARTGGGLVVLLSVSGLLVSGLLLSGFLWSTLWFGSDTSESNRRAFLEMEFDLRKEIVRKWDRFQALPAEEQLRLRQFHARLESQPNVDRLREIMNHYFDWTLALSDRERAVLSVETLAVTTPQQRQERIEQLQKIRLSQYEQNLGRDEATRLSLADLTLFVDWWNQRVERLQGESRASRVDRESMRVNLWPPTDEELDDLQTRFSPKAAALMQQAKERPTESRDGRQIDGRVNLVVNWIQAAFVRPSRAMLKAVYDSLDEEERLALSDLREMTPEAVERKLLEYYSQRARIPYGIPGMGGRQRGFGGGPPPGPGPGRGGPPPPPRGPEGRRDGS